MNTINPTMSTTKSKINKGDIIKKTQRHDSDTGSAPVQISILTEEILNLTNHLKVNPKDISSRRGLLKKVGKRRSLLRYLATNNSDDYREVLQTNNLKS